MSPCESEFRYVRASSRLSSMTELSHVRIDRDPHHAAGPRARATHRVGFLEQSDVSASVGRADSRGESGRPGAQHDNVERLHGTPCWLMYV